MAWDLDGNGNIGTSNWLGTRNNASLVIRTENAGGTPTAGTEAMRITPAAQGRAVCIGTQTPAARAKLTVTGGDITWGNNSRLQPDQGGSIELGGDNNTPGTGTPYIDFHFQGLAQDFNTRIINDAVGQLTISALALRALANIFVRGNLTLDSDNVLLPNANAGTAGNLYFGGRTDAGQTGLRLFGGLVNGVIPAGFIDVRTTAPTDGLRIRVDTNNGSTEKMRVTSNNIQFFVPTSGGSDVRTKTSIRRLDRVLDKLDSVRGVAFNWAESPQTPGDVTGRPGIGVIAQEVEEVFPELVCAYGDHGYKAVDYSGLSGVLIEAAKELRAENETLRSRIEALEGTQQ